MMFTMFDLMKTHRDLVVLIVGALAISGVFVYLYARSGGSQTATVLEEEDVVSVVGGGVEVESTGGEAIVREVSTQAPPPPDFQKPLVFSESVPSETRLAYTALFDEAVEMLERDSVDYQGWVTLGILRKFVNDYRGAEEAWGYAASIYPQSTVPFSNLGSLYLDFIKDYPKAEANYKQVLANDPHDINSYQQLVSLYTVYGYKDASTARVLIEQGLSENLGNQTLLQLRAQIGE